MGSTLRRLIKLKKGVILGIVAFFGVMVLLVALLLGTATVLDTFGLYDPVLTIGLLGLLGLVAVIAFFYYSFNQL